MKLTEIRIVIYVPDQDHEKTPEVVRKLIEVVKEEYPEFQLSRLHSPVTVTVKELAEDGGAAIDPKDYP
jgi:hypothetical protein